MHCSDIHHGAAHSTHAHRLARSFNFSAFSLIAYTLGSRRLCFLIAFAQWFRAGSALFIPTHALLTLFRRLNRVAWNEVDPCKFLSLEITDASRSKLRPTHALDTSSLARPPHPPDK